MKNIVSWLVLAVAVVALLVVIVRPAGHDGAPKEETAFERVMRTRTIRCGYAIWNPSLFKDMKTGEMRGITHDIMEEVGKKLDLRIDWAEEAGWGSIVEGLATRRYDAVCNGLGVNGARAKAIDFSAPLFYVTTYLVVRADETRIQKTEDANDPIIKIAVLEGEIFSFLAPKKFPKAQIKPLPQNTDWSLIFQDIETKKADVAGVPYTDFVGYEKTNPGKMKIVDLGSPPLVYAMAFGLPQSDVALKTMIDAALAELAADGTIERAIHAYSSSPQEFLLPLKPYAISAP